MRCLMIGTQQDTKPMTNGVTTRKDVDGPLLTLYRAWRQSMSSSSISDTSKEPRLLSLSFRQGRVDILSWDGHSVKVKGGISY